MKLLFFIIMLLLTAGNILAQRPERDSAQVAETERKVRDKMIAEDLMKWAALQNAEQQERQNPSHRLDSAARAAHEKRFKRAPR